MHTLIKDAIAQNHLILTANARQSRNLQERWIRETLHPGQTLPSPLILPIEQWLKTLWETLQLHRQSPAADYRLASADFEEHLWLKLLREHPPESLQALDAPPPVKDMLAAYRLCKEYQIDWQDPDIAEWFQLRPEWQWFRQQARHFEEACEKRKICTPAQMPALLAESTRDAYEKKPGALLLFFERIAPVYQQVLEQCFEDACIPEADDIPPENNHFRVDTHSAVEERQQVIQWAYDILSKNPKARIHIIDPQLPKNRIYWETGMATFLNHHLLSPDKADTPLPINFSAGAPLGDQPIIACAMNLLSLALKPLSLNTLYGLINAPWSLLGQPASTHYLQTRLAYAKENTLTLSQAIRLWSETSSSADCPDEALNHLRQQLESFKHTIRRAPKASLSAWGKVFIDALHQLGWPSLQPLDSINHQRVARFYELIRNLHELDSLYPNLSANEACNTLRSLAAKTVFQPETPSSNIQVLGLLEGAGLQTDYCWIVGLNAQVFPAPLRPNEFIPLPLQRQLELPHASARKEMEYAQKLLHTYRTSSRELITSFADSQDGQPTLASPLIDQVPLLPDQLPPQVVPTVPNLETLDDHLAPAVSGNEKITGGSRILEDQSACPFRSFAFHRLKVRSQDLPDLGISAADLGTVIHRCLEILWKDLGNLDTLKALSVGEEYTRVEQAVEQTLKPLMLDYPNTLGPAFLELEKARLITLITEWLALEKQRPAYFQVTGCEVRLKENFAGIPLALRIDRMDDTPAGRLVIDYKTGKNLSPADWMGERPTRPQLPLYALLLDPPPRGIAYGQVTQPPAYISLCDTSLQDSLTAPKKGKETKDKPAEKTWEDWLADWEHSLSKLAEEFLAGEAVVAPQKDACKYCQLKLACRIAASQTGSPETLEAE